MPPNHLTIRLHGPPSFSSLHVVDGTREAYWTNHHTSLLNDQCWGYANRALPFLVCDQCWGGLQVITKAHELPPPFLAHGWRQGTCERWWRHTNRCRGWIAPSSCLPVIDDTSVYRLCTSSRLCWGRPVIGRRTVVNMIEWFFLIKYFYKIFLIV